MELSVQCEDGSRLSVATSESDKVNIFIDLFFFSFFLCFFRLFFMFISFWMNSTFD